MTIRDYKYIELYKNKQQLAQELQILDKKGGEKQEKENLKKQLAQAEKKYSDYLIKREKYYPTCPLCQKKVQPGCLKVEGVPRNYHIECYYQVEELIAKKKQDNLNHKTHDNNVSLLAKLEKIEKEVESIKKILMKN